jgi:hypothetical protein
MDRVQVPLRTRAMAVVARRICNSSPRGLRRLARRMSARFDKFKL